MDFTVNTDHEPPSHPEAVIAAGDNSVPPKSMEDLDGTLPPEPASDGTGIQESPSKRRKLNDPSSKHEADQEANMSRRKGMAPVKAE